MKLEQNPLSGRHYGEVSSIRTVADFILTETSYAPGSELPQHSHERACFCLVLKGAYDEIYRGQTLSCAPMTLVLRPPGETHSDRFRDSAVRCFIFEFELGWLERVRRHARVLDSPALLRGGLPIQLAMRLYGESRRIDDFTPLAIEGLALELLAEGSRRLAQESIGRPPRWLERAREILRERFREPPSLAETADAVGVHPVHLAREFRRRYHCTAGEYVRRLRIEYVCREMVSSDAPLVDIALTAGFSHQAHFSRSFKSIMGMTPTEYRALRRPR